MTVFEKKKKNNPQIWAPNQMANVLIRDRRQTPLERREERPCDHRGRDWGDAFIPPGTPGATRNCKRQARIFP